MSTLVSKNVQVGTSGTATDNFTIFQPATPDGTLRIGNGNTGITTSLLSLTSTGAIGVGGANYGTSGQFLQSNGTAAAPSWTTPTTVNNGTLTMNVSGTGLSGSQTFTANQSSNATFTVTSNATNANTASTIVARDASGNFSAGTITATLSGNASTATSATTATTATNQSGGTVNATGITFTGTQIIASGSASTYGATSIRGSKNTWSGISFYDSSNVFCNTLMARSSDGYGGIYNKADNAWMLQWDGSSNFTATGNVTAYSDERLKKDWSPVAEDFVERLTAIKTGTYTRIDTDQRQAGSSAQDWQKLLPEVVHTDDEGHLTLAYGNAALVAAVKLAERVVALEARLAALEAKG